MRTRIQTKLLAALFTILAIPMFAGGAFGQSTTCSYYASPTGTGNGLSPSSPFKIASFWKVARPGYTLCLLDGTYTGSDSMIRPPQGLNGTATQRITIKALNDGAVRIDGGGSRHPVALKYNDYFIIEGLDAYNSSGTVVLLGTGADNNVVRRVCAWDAPDDGNFAVWGIHHNTGNLLEDVCGFGNGRKIFSSSQKGNGATIRRAWGQWSRNTIIGPKMTYTIAYNNYNAIYENVIGTWSETDMGGSVNQPYGILSMDGIVSGKDPCARSRYLGSIAYVRNSDVLSGFIGGLRTSNGTDCLNYKDNVVFLGSNHSGTRALSALTLRAAKTGYTPANEHILRNNTEIGGKTASLGNDWQVSNRAVGATVADVPNIWNGAGTSGARVCKRYVNGVLTSEPLWPWPMNQRIINAMKAAGKKPVDVTRTMEEIFGPIPSECRTSSSGNSSTGTTSATPPSSPKNLRLQQ